MMNNIRFLIVYLVFSNFTHAQTVTTIGTQVWMAKNLNVSTFRNGDTIPEAKTNEEWEKAGNNKQPAWCYYDNDTKKGAKYGKLYNWYAVIDPRGLAPTGYHIPLNEEWASLYYFLGNEDGSGKKIKSANGWNNGVKECTNCSSWTQEYRRKAVCNSCKDSRKMPTSGNGTNRFGFNGLPSGYRSEDGSYYGIGDIIYWWSFSENNDYHAWCASLSLPSGVYDLLDVNNYKKKGEGLSVRCIKD